MPLKTHDLITTKTLHPDKIFYFIAFAGTNWRPTTPAPAWKQKSSLETSVNNPSKNEKPLKRNWRNTKKVTNVVFACADEIQEFHSACLLPELERCGTNTQQVQYVIEDKI
jgi:hypothetical protein